MATVSMTGQDTIIINNRVFNDLADGDCVDLTFPNDIAAVKTGKNGNTLYAFNASGTQSQVILRIVRGAPDDKFLQSLLAAQQSNFSATILMFGEFVKKIGNGLGGVNSDTYILGGGVILKIPEAKSNVESDTNQSVTVWTLRFGTAPRVIS